VSDLSKLKKFENAAYRESYLDSHVKSSIAYQIQELRAKDGLSQTAFGALVGMPQEVISRIENQHGNVNVNTLLKIANRRGIGLQIKFCNFEVILKEDVSPAGLQVETVEETIRRLSPAPSRAYVAASGAASNIQISEGLSTWLTSTVHNQPSPSFLVVSGTSNFGSYIQTQVSSP
jgi:transcriptional regulator with XRE-family HTH domain